MNIIRNYKIKYLLRKSIVRFFLFAMGSSGGTVATSTSMVDEIRKRKYKILLIDDNKGFREAFLFLLEDIYNATVIDVDSGKLGIEKLKYGDMYDFIFTDLFMPRMTGIDTYHEIRKMDRYVRIVIMSAHPDTNEWKQAEKLSDVKLFDKATDQESDELTRILFDSKGI